ncbi:MAG: pyridoxal phosphate-dependent aminotransferase [Bacteroidales bacterium]|nr:pyridoxal phosphate-dependent aminotransferase [Bacteroidales bacterium]MDD3860158.1 pyridoxal phosphate-dependent aminotransferase [Bacteroidales bacterium]
MKKTFDPDIKIEGSLIRHFSNLVKINGGINLAQGIPGYSPPEKLLELLSEARSKDVHQYAPGSGNTSLLDYLYHKYNASTILADIIITNGATEAISLIYNYLMYITDNRNFNVAAFSPAYESYIHLPQIFGHKFFSKIIDDENYFDENSLENFFIDNKIKLLFIASPGNPYGKSISKSKLDFLISLAEKYHAYIIIDAVYNELYFKEAQNLLTDNVISKNVFFVNSFSKMFSITGWRVGYLIMHNSHYTKMCYTHDYIGLSAPAPLQYAIAEFVNSSNYSQYIIGLREKIKSNYIYAVEKLSKEGFYCPHADGGYFVWCRLPNGFNDSLKFGLDIYEQTKTAIIPGVHFGKEWNNYIRINVARKETEFKLGIENIIEFVKKNL